VAPFDETFRKPDDFSERVARNQQLILREESYFDKVADPAAGSYYIENLTKLIADASWKLFVETEENGGFLEVLKQGSIQRRITESAEKRRQDVTSGKIKLLGTNLYPNVKEKVSQDHDSTRMFREKPSNHDNIIEPVILFRGAEDTERKRLSGTEEGEKGL
jgi:methylmalonyl-CoA mutase